MCHLTRATQGNLLEETTTTPTSLAPPEINGFSGVTIEPDLNDVVPEMLHVQVLKDGGCVYLREEHAVKPCMRCCRARLGWG